MPQLTIAKDVPASASKLWSLLADFGDVSWIPVIQSVDVTGEGVGMSRAIHGTGDRPVVETLTRLDPVGMELGYSITDNPLPVNRFDAVVTVRPSTEGSTVTWHVDYDAAGPTDADARTARDAIDAVYGMMADWLADAAAGKSGT